VLLASPIGRIELRDRMQVLEILRPYTTSDLGGRIGFEFSPPASPDAFAQFIARDLEH
jgi:hypothetical protein